MELDFWEVGLRHRQHIVGIGEEYVATLTVKRHELMLALLEGLQCRRVIALNPTCLVKAQRLPAALCAVFVEQTVLDNLKLQLTDGSNQLAAVEMIDKQLCHTFLHQLLDTLV